jgi:CheY-like chemotaxis protein
MTDRVRILVVDDDPYLLDLLIETLKTIGYEACGASDAAQALALLQKTAVHLVITDIKMPGMNGIELAHRIRQEHPQLPVIFISGVFTSSILKTIDKEPHLPKPFRIGQLEELIARVVAEKTGEEAARTQTVLVVDDDESFRVMLAETLKISGYSVRSVTDGETAVRLLQEGGIAAVITDIKMPGMGGIALARHVRQNHPGLPVILITAYLSGTEQKEGAMVADGFLMKPFRIESITALLEDLRDSRLPPSKPI